MRWVEHIALPDAWFRSRPAPVTLEVPWVVGHSAMAGRTKVLEEIDIGSCGDGSGVFKNST